MDFWGLTLKEFSALLDRLSIDREWQNYRPALICSLLANIHRDPKAKPYTPQDFMPGVEKKKQTPEEMLAIVQSWQILYENKYQ